MTTAVPESAIHVDIDAHEIVTKVDEFLDLFDDDIIHLSIATNLTCTEVDALADLYRQRGREEAAERWIDAHAKGDDEGDSHFVKITLDEDAFLEVVDGS